MKRRIAVFTGTRAEYSVMRAVLLLLHKAPDVELQLLVSGGHLAASQGMTVSEIYHDALPIAARIDIGLDEQPPLPAYVSLARTVEGTASSLEALSPDLLLLLGDRYEAMGAAMAATMLNVPLAHIGGGDSTSGAMDDVFRHSITKMSHLHFPDCEAHRQRIIQLGEMPEHVWNVGALGVENILTLQRMGENEIRSELGLSPEGKYLLCTFHPATLEKGLEEGQVAELLCALEYFREYEIIFTGANADPGGSAINHMLKVWTQKMQPEAHYFLSLGGLRYLSAAKYAACVVGNSSSGVVEIPSLGTPVVDIGDRQKGRIRSEAVIHCDVDREDIVAALRLACSEEHRKIAQETPNPYTGCNTAESICQILRSYDLGNILKKNFHSIIQS